MADWQFEVGQEYTLLKTGGALSGWKYAGQSSWSNIGCQLVPGSRVVYEGAYSFGSDGIPEDTFTDQHTGVRGTFNHGSWGSADKSYFTPTPAGPSEYDLDMAALREAVTLLQAGGIAAWFEFQTVDAERPDGLYMMLDKDGDEWRVGVYPIDKTDNMVGEEAIEVVVTEGTVEDAVTLFANEYGKTF